VETPDRRRGAQGFLNNRLLAALPAEAGDALAPLLEPVPLRLGEALFEPGGKQAYVYFPTDSIISLLYVLENGASAEIAVTDNEGVVGARCSMRCCVSRKP
jgi:hypothetical protein